MTRLSSVPAWRTSPWFVLAIVSLPVFIGALDLTIISAVLPEVITSLELPVKEYLDQASWAVTGYLLAYAISMTFAGRLSDLLGRRVVYIGCLVVFMFGSYMVTAYDSSLINGWIARFYNTVLDQRPPRLEERYLYLVIAGRIVQALGAGAMVPVTIALAGDLFPPARRAQPIGFIGAIDTLGWVLGHLYGGVMVRFFGEQGHHFVNAFADLGITIAKPSWETLFILNIPITFVALLGAWWVLRGIDRPHTTGRFDIWGMVLISIALIGLNLGVGTTSPETATTASSFEDLQSSTATASTLFLIVAALAFIGFLLVESRIHSPLIPLKLFRSRNFATASVTNLMVGFCLAIGLVSAPLLVNFRVETPTSDEIQNAAYIAGVLLSGLTIPIALAAVPGGWLSDRYGYRRPTTLGLALAAGGFLLTGLFWDTDTPYWLMGSQMAIIGVGLGLTISPIGTAVLNDVPEEDRGVASALVLILRLIGMTLAISSLTIFALDRFDVHIDNYTDYPEPDTIETTDESAINATLSAAVDVIKELQFIGAAISGLGFGIALLLRGGKSVPSRPDHGGKRTSQELSGAIPDD